VSLVSSVASASVVVVRVRTRRPLSSALWPSLVQECDERAPEWHAANETFRPIDGVEHPHEVCAVAFGAVFFADNAVRGELGFDFLAQERFGVAVGFRYGALVCFVLNGECGEVVGESAREVGFEELAARVGELSQKISINA